MAWKGADGRAGMDFHDDIGEESKGSFGAGLIFSGGSKVFAYQKSYGLLLLFP